MYTCTLLLCIITALIVMRKLSHRRTPKLLLPPGPLRFPIIGHLHLLGKLPHQSLSELSKVHGPLMFLRLGRAPVLVASSPEMARLILQTHDLAFANRLSNIAVTNNIFGRGLDMAFSPPNAHWKLTRRLFAAEIGSSKGLDFFKPVRVEETRALMRSVLADSMDAPPRPQQMRRKLQGTMFDIMMGMIFGAKHGHSLHKARIVELVEETLQLMGMFNVGDFLPCIAWMDLQGCERRSKRVGAEFRAAFEGIINARRQLADGGHPPNDYLGMLLQASASSDTPINMLEVILDLLTAGTDTTAISIEWVLVELLLNPQKMRVLQAEIDEVVGRARVIQEEDIDNLPFLVACVKETMRLHPAGPLLIPHKNEKACKILAFHIPANTQVYVNTWAIGRDPKVWENPKEFSPDRFLNVNTSGHVLGQQFEFLPFGSGRRMCPGWRLGLLSVHVILANLLQGFEWSIPPTYHLDTTECFSLNLCLSNPLFACTTPRLPKELY